VNFTVTENDLTAVQKSMAAGAVKVEVRLPTNGRTANGRPDLSRQCRAGSDRHREMRATIPMTTVALAQSIVKARVVLSTLPKAVLVPQARRNFPQRRVVYVVKDDSTAEIAAVKLASGGRLIVIQEGVRAGEQIVVNGQIGVTPGAGPHRRSTGRGACRKRGGGNASKVHGRRCGRSRRRRRKSAIASVNLSEPFIRRGHYAVLTVSWWFLAC